MLALLTYCKNALGMKTVNARVFLKHSWKIVLRWPNGGNEKRKVGDLYRAVNANKSSRPRTCFHNNAGSG